jgi:hypothetical protein
MSATISATKTKTEVRAWVQSQIRLGRSPPPATARWSTDHRRPEVLGRKALATANSFLRNELSWRWGGTQPHENGVRMRAGLSTRDLVAESGPIIPASHGTSSLLKSSSDESRTADRSPSHVSPAPARLWRRGGGFGAEHASLLFFFLVFSERAERRGVGAGCQRIFRIAVMRPGGTPTDEKRLSRRGHRRGGTIFIATQPPRLLWQFPFFGPSLGQYERRRGSIRRRDE